MLATRPERPTGSANQSTERSPGVHGFDGTVASSRPAPSEASTNRIVADWRQVQPTAGLYSRGTNEVHHPWARCLRLQ